ncbi:hypothetical protein C0J52_24548 [Blattella germanica]|nr:hypothetical protein C0J52_24548 [Blattella germanica]
MHVDAREHEFRAAERWSDENVFANRAYFMPDKQPAELGVDNIRKDDAGIYRCRVDFKVAQTRNSKVNLTVIGWGLGLFPLGTQPEKVYALELSVHLSCEGVRNVWVRGAI